jgi:hypothetical protein
MYEELAASAGEVMEFYRLLFNEDDDLGGAGGGEAISLAALPDLRLFD